MHVSRFLSQVFVLVGLAGCAAHAPEGSGGGGLARPEPASPPVAESPAPGSRPAAGFVVHEWGTFTSMQGVDGLAVDGLQHEGDALPSFVHAATSPATPSPYHLWGDVSLDIPVHHVNSKMETPVVYFYSDVPRQVSVRVDFEGGLLSEWFPRAAIAPGSTHGAVDIADVHRSALAWDVALTPFAAGPPAAMPEVSKNDPWSFARDVGASFVTVKGKGDAPAEVEHYLFYRGLARMKLPLAVQPIGESGAVLVNRSDTPIDASFVLEVGETNARFTRANRAIGAGESAAVMVARATLRPKAEVVKDLSRDVAEMLVGHGLYPDEARAMVRTWSSTWFATEGTRVLYVIPRKTVDQVLKLSIAPVPDRLERVIVARQEFLTPAAAQDVETALKERTAPATRDQAMRRLARLGRFLEPVARLVAAKSTDAVVRTSAAEIIAGYRAP